MPIARSLRSLAFYDLLTNLIPGVVYLSAVTLLVSPPPGTVDIPVGILVSGFVVVSFTIGHLVQAAASWLETPKTFGQIIKALQEDNPVEAPFAITYVEKEFWDTCKTNFNIPDPENFDDYGRLFKLLLSHLETTPHTRALRFQALHAFHRSMWAASMLLFISVPILMILSHFGLVNLNSLPTAAVVFIASIIGWAGFRSRKEKFDETFVKYVITDIYDAYEVKHNSSQNSR